MPMYSGGFLDNACNPHQKHCVINHQYFLMTELQDAPPNPFEDDVVEDVDDVAGDNQTSSATDSPPVSFNWDFDGKRRKKFACAGLSKTIRRTNADNSLNKC